MNGESGGRQVYIEVYGRVNDPLTLPASASISGISGNPSLLSVESLYERLAG